MKISECLNDNYIGREVELRGWIYRIRESGKILFLILRDSTNIMQCVVTADNVSPEEFKKVKRAGVESSVIVQGIVKKDIRAVTGYEVACTHIEIVNSAEPFPITKDKSDEYLSNVRHLWLRSREMTAILKIRSTIFQALHNFFHQEGYYEVQAPMFVSSAVEGGATLFEVPYFGKKLYLTQSSQFYLETFIYSLEKVYTIAPSFRAEKSRTRRHLAEFWHAEAEAAWMSNADMMQFEERMILYIVQYVLEQRKEDLKLLNRDLSKLENLHIPFKRTKYEEIIDIGKEVGLDLEYGEDLGADEEYAITKSFDTPVFVTNFPINLKPFYHRIDPSDASVVLNHDLLAPEGYGEIIGGGERTYELHELLTRIQKEHLNAEDYKWYIDLRKYGSVPHSGFGLGIDRLVMWIAGLEHIKYAVPYPRTMRRVYP